MKNRHHGGQSETGQRIAQRAHSTPFKKRQHNHAIRLGGGGLSLEAFAAAKSKPFITPAQKREHRELYTNAKKVQKYKKLVAQLARDDRGLKGEEAAEVPGRLQETNGKNSPANKSVVGFASWKRQSWNTHGKQFKHRKQLLQQPKVNSLVETARDEFQKKEFDEKANGEELHRVETARDEFQKKEFDEKANGEELHREQPQVKETVKHDGKVTQARLRKKTQRGQPVMKHQMERLLEAIRRTS